MQDKDINKEKEEKRERPKRTLTAHEGLMFSSTNPTNKDILEHEKNIETFHKKVPVKVTRYNDAYYEKIKEKQKEQLKTFAGLVVIIILAVTGVKFFRGGERNPLFQIRLSDEEETTEKIKINKKTMGLAEAGSKIADNFQVVGDEDLFDKQGLIRLSTKKAQGSDKLPDSLKDFTGEVFSTSQKDQTKEQEKGKVIYLNRLFGGSKKSTEKDKEKENAKKAAEGKNQATAGNDSAGEEISNVKQAKNKEGMYFDDPFNLTSSEEFFPNYSTLNTIFKKTEDLDVEFLKQIADISRKGIDQKMLDEKRDVRLELESLKSKIEVASFKEDDLKEWTVAQVSYYRDLEKYLIDANKVLDEEKFKYLKWMSIKSRLEKNDMIELSINFSDSDKESGEVKKEFANNWAEYRDGIGGVDSTSKRQKQTELKEKIFNQIGNTSTKIFLTMAILADSMNYAEQEKEKLYSTFKFVDKDLSNKGNREQLINGLESLRVDAERTLQAKEALFSLNDERSSIILRKLKGS